MYRHISSCQPNCCRLDSLSQWGDAYFQVMKWRLLPSEYRYLSGSIFHQSAGVFIAPNLRAWPSAEIESVETVNKKVNKASPVSVTVASNIGQERDIAEEEKGRASVYSLLGALLTNPPQQEMLNYLMGIRSNGQQQEGMIGAWQTLRMAAQRAEQEAVAEEYHDLFIGVGRGELVPYGSWYLTGFLMEKPLGILRNDLAVLGFERQEDVKEPEDHAAALCETMAMIISSGDEIDFESQKTFFSDHVGSWMDRFFTDLRKATAAKFYIAVGELGSEMMLMEKKYFEMLV